MATDTITRADRCAVPACDGAIRALGLCTKHYERRRQHGDVNVVLPNAGGIPSNTWAAVPALLVARRRINHATGCWEWTGANRKGYGVIRVEGKSRYVTRVAAAVHLGLDIDDSTTWVLHRCDNPPCFNWEGHLYLGGRAENGRDMSERGRVARTLARLSWAEVEAIRRLYASGDVSQAQLAERFGTTQGNISKIILELTWKR